MRRFDLLTLALILLGAPYLLFLVALLAANLLWVSPAAIRDVLADADLRAAMGLTLATSAASSLAAMLVGVPLGYALARRRFYGKPVAEMLLELPFVVPPLVIGVSLLLFFSSSLGRAIQSMTGAISYEVPAIVIAQVTVCAAYAARMMRVAFEATSPRPELIAQTLGCTPFQAFRYVALPQVRSALQSTGLLVWSKALGEFGPIVLFAGITRRKTEVASTSIYLEWTLGNVDRAIAISLILMAISLAVIAIVKRLGTPR